MIAQANPTGRSDEEIKEAKQQLIKFFDSKKEECSITSLYFQVLSLSCYFDLLL